MFKWFYNISWSLQLAVGLVLFGVTAVLEAMVLAAYLDSLLLGVCIAGGLEAAKVLTIVLYRLLNGQQEVTYPLGVRRLTLGFRVMLIGLSAACSVMFLALHLDRPALERVRAADLAAADQGYRADLAAAQAGYVDRRDRTAARLGEQDRREREALAQRYLPAIAALESRLDAEMGNVIGGEFKGKRYKALADRLTAEKDAYAAAQAVVDRSAAERPTDQLDRLETEHRARQTALAEHHQADLAAIRNADYQGDARVEHPMARAFVSVLGAVFARQPSTLQFVFYFALFLSLTMEFGIYVAFEHITLARLQVFTAEHRAELFVAGKAVETDSELRGFELDDDLARAKVRRKQRGIADLLRGNPHEKLAEHG
ncbi:MAG TPA: hypothetical protein VES73_06780 [Lamprocystis sp. (in: g-proteobacteria)]|nr:hypothetical protein [Lamprocystis sp. (in: g-proteobacteria)]